MRSSPVWFRHIHTDQIPQSATSSMAMMNTGSGSEIRHRLDLQSRLPPVQEPSSTPARRSRRDVVRPKDKGKRRAFGWGVGQDGWVEEKFRRFGEHCARNQVSRRLDTYSRLHANAWSQPGRGICAGLIPTPKEIAPLAMKILGDVLGIERHSSNTVDPHPPDRLPGDDQPFLSLTRDISIQALSAAISRLPIRTSPSRSVACCTSRASAVSPDYALTGWILPLSTSPAAKACLDGMVGSYPRRG